MPDPSDDLSELNVVLEEARLFGVEYDSLRRSFMVDLHILCLPSREDAPDRRLIQLRLWPVGRVLASLTDIGAGPAELTFERLSSEVASFGGLAIYGWEFFDVPVSPTPQSESAKLDVTLGDSPSSHNLYLFQENARKALDLRIWFDQLEFRSESGKPLEPQLLVAEAKRWWDALASGDPRTAKAGIYPIGTRKS